MTPARLTAVLSAVFAAVVASAYAGRQSNSAASHALKPQQSTAARAGAESFPSAPAKLPLTSAEKAHNSIAALPALPFHNTTIVVDPAHGGSDNGSRIDDNIVEKDVTLALAFRLRSLLAARGFTVVLTRDSDAGNNSAPPFAPLSLDDRAGLANHERAAACLLLHATSRGTGVHLYSSELSPSPQETTPQPWLTGQSPWVPQSQRLNSQLSDALNRARLPLVSGSASVRPVDSLTCPALVLELAPPSGSPATINDAGYQQRVAEAVAGALVLWKDRVQPPARATLAPVAPKTEVRP